MSDQRKAPMRRGLVSARKRPPATGGSPPPRDRNVRRNTDDQRKEQLTLQMNAMASNLIKSKTNNSSASRKRRATEVIATPSISDGVDVNKRKTVTLVQSTEMPIQGTMEQLRNSTAPTNVAVVEADEVDPENRAQINPNPANPPMNELTKKLAQDFSNDGPSIDMMFTPNVNGLNPDAIKVSSAVVAAWGLHSGEEASAEELANSSDFDWDENCSMVVNDRCMLRQSYLSLLKFLHTSEPLDKVVNLMNVIELLYDPCAFTKLATAVCIAHSVRWMSTENLDLLIKAIENLSSVDSRTFNVQTFAASCAHLRKNRNRLEMVDLKIQDNLTYDIQQSLKAFVQPMSRVECMQCEELSCYLALCQTYFLFTEIHLSDIPLNVTLKKFEELRVKANGNTVTIRTSIRGQEMSGSAEVSYIHLEVLKLWSSATPNEIRSIDVKIEFGYQNRVVQQLINKMYGIDNPMICKEYVLDAFLICNQLKIEDPFKLIKLTEENFSLMLEKDVKSSNKQLIAFLLEHPNAWINKTDLIRTLSSELMQTFVSSDDFNLAEIEIVKFCLRWAKMDNGGGEVGDRNFDETTKAKFMSVQGYLRPSLLELEEFGELCRDKDHGRLIKSCMDTCEILLHLSLCKPGPVNCECTYAAEKNRKYER